MAVMRVNPTRMELTLSLIHISVVHRILLHPHESGVGISLAVAVPLTHDCLLYTSEKIFTEIWSQYVSNRNFLTD